MSSSFQHDACSNSYILLSTYNATTCADLVQREGKASAEYASFVRMPVHGELVLVSHGTPLPLATMENPKRSSLKVEEKTQKTRGRVDTTILNGQNEQAEDHAGQSLLRGAIRVGLRISNTPLFQLLPLTLSAVCKVAQAQADEGQ